jgi:putative ABC transport system permease protein
LPRVKRKNCAWLFLRMAFQNTQRRPSRTLMLITAVALGTAALFSSFLVARGITASTNQSFARMGADLIVVPENAMVNITSALLTVQPTKQTIDRKTLNEIGKLNGVDLVAPQTIYNMSVMAGMPQHRVNVIAFDPARDFTIMPWLNARLPRPMVSGDIISGARRGEQINEEIQPANIPCTIYGKLGHSGVGPLDDSLFVTYETLTRLSQGPDADNYIESKIDPDRVSAVLVRLKIGATPEQVRFAIARLPNVKVVQGTTIVTSTRQTTTILFAGMIAFAAVMLLGSLILVGLLFSAIISERRKEVGVLSAIGARRGDIVTMLLGEAGITTGIGGFVGILLGCGLLLGFQNSLVYYLQTLHVDFIWPPLSDLCLVGVSCSGLAIAVGIVAAMLPAWAASNEEAYALIQREDAHC